ncbi:MAG: tRNA pseudouridine(55) synthase TruB [Eubacteriales bacterium]|nr:tRNA pseudouridine(55) synthase TruB [Eubacteriales bacterium]
MGTLVPDARCVLPVAMGNETRLFDHADGEKEYGAGLRLGAVTDTGDASGAVLQKRPVSATADEVRTALAAFTGTIRQIPPRFSAVKVNGRAAYRLARADKPVELPAREVTIREAVYLRQENEVTHVIRIRCSRGTYIRTLCADVGEKLGCGAYMSFLVRTEAAGLRIEQARTLDEIRSDPAGAILRADRVLGGIPCAFLATEQRDALFNGRSVSTEANGWSRVYCGEDFLGVGMAEHGELRMKVRL